MKTMRLTVALILLTCSSVSAQVERVAHTQRLNDPSRNEAGILIHEVESLFQKGKTQIRVLLPGNLKVGERCPVVYVLPVESPDENRYGDGLLVIQKNDLHNTHRTIFVAPTFSHLPWYADHPTNDEIRQESHFLKVVIPFVEKTYPARAERDGRLLLGFSKSGWGAWSLLLRHPDLFGKAAAWDAPLNKERPDQFGMGEIFGTQENFEKYQISALLTKQAELLSREKRLVLLGYDNFRDHHEAIHALLGKLKIPHEYRDGPKRKHVWDSGWIPDAASLLVSATTDHATKSANGKKPIEWGWDEPDTKSLRENIEKLEQLSFPASAAEPADTAPINIGSRRELFVDDALVGTMTGKVEFRLHHPTPQQVAIKYDQPWEGNASGYATVFRDGDLYRMYYRGHRYLIDAKPLRQAQAEVVCYAESRDGIIWVKPKLGLFSWNGSKDNNILWLGGPETHNFAPFKDSNPNCLPDERYKAIGGTVTSKGLLTFKSADGVHWSKLSEGPVVTTGAFDSHNTCFWDADRGRYTMYVRFFSEGQFKGLRSIGVAYSTDFKTWSEPVGLSYPHSPAQQMYTNQIAPYYRAPHILLGFPTRYVARPLNEHGRQLDPVPLRDRLTRSHQRVGTDLTDGLIMTSRDGQSFRRWDEAFLRPGPQTEGRWIYGDNYQTYGLWETKSATAGAPPEISLHFSEHAWVDEEHQARRYTIRLDGFVSLHAAYAGGEVVTKPLAFLGHRLTLNYATSAAGSVRVELQDASGQPLPGFALNDSTELYGDSPEQIVSWKGGHNLELLQGKPIRVRFELKDADLFAMQFAGND